MALDTRENVYVTGTVRSSGTSSDYATVKYDRNGNELWVAEYDGDFFDYAAANTVDRAGNVYVYGFSCGSGGGAPCGYVTVKYNQPIGRINRLFGIPAIH